MAKQGVKGGKGSKASAVDDDDEYSSAEELKTAIKTTKDNLQILAEDSTFFLNSLARKECDSKEGRDKLREKLRAEPPLKGG